MKKGITVILSLFWIMVAFVACNRDEISFETPSQPLRFSRDTVFCDTVFKQVRSETYAVKVYNDEDKDITIPNISLERGAASEYRINVDGKPGYSFDNVPLRKKDSMYIFVEIAPQSSGMDVIAEDHIIFSMPTGKQHVTLFSVVQDAEFFVQTGANPVLISGNTTWNNSKVKVIYGNVKIAQNSTLNIDAGTRIFFHKNSGMQVSGGATVNVNGNLGGEVIFRGDRSDPKYDTIPKNWNSIKFDANSTLNMNYARIFGGTRGLEFTQANANISNSIIHTFQEYGIYSVNSTISAKNLAINNCGEADFGIFKGGNVNLTHVSLANYWQFSSGGNEYSLYATNEWKNASGQTENAPLNLSVKNSVLYGNALSSVVLKPVTGQNFSYLFQNSLMKYDSSNAGFNFDSNASVVNSLKNLEPKFMNVSSEKLNLRVKADSPAKNKGDVSVANSVPLDLVKISRISSPTLGAYQ